MQVETWLAAYRERVPPAWQEHIDAAVEQLGTPLNPLLAGIGSGALRTAGNLLSIVMGYLLIPFWLFYVLGDQDRLVSALRSAVPAGMQQDADACVAIVHRVVIAYIRAQLLLGLLVGSATALGLALMGIPFALIAPRYHGRSLGSAKAGSRKGSLGPRLGSMAHIAGVCVIEEQYGEILKDMNI